MVTLSKFSHYSQVMKTANSAYEFYGRSYRPIIHVYRRRFNVWSLPGNTHAVHWGDHGQTSGCLTKLGICPVKYTTFFVTDTSDSMVCQSWPRAGILGDSCKDSASGYRSMENVPQTCWIGNGCQLVTSVCIDLHQRIFHCWCYASFQSRT